jgi:glucose/arabinose dehydrogenase
MTGGRRLPLLFLTVALPLLLSVSCGGNDATTGPSPTSPPTVYNFGLNSEVVAGNGDADNVSAIAFAPDGRMFYAEQFTGESGNYQGVIRVIGRDGILQAEPFASMPVANYLGLDWGLTGLALDPDFESNHYVYAFYTAVVGDNIGKPRLVRFTDENGIGTDETVISEDFPLTILNYQGYNTNGEIHFGADGYLYLSVGDYDQGTAKADIGGDPSRATSLSTPIGKLLRIDAADGTAAPDNPLLNDADADPRIFAYGFREPFPFAFDSAGNIYGSDNTPVNCEELNLIKSGEDYGWPSVWVFPFSDCSVGVGTQPIYNFASEGAQPGDFLSFVESQGISFLTGSSYSQLGDSLLICESDDAAGPGGLRQITLAGVEAVASSASVVNDCKGEVAVHNGVVYYANGTEIRKLIEGGAAPATNTSNEIPAPITP